MPASTFIFILYAVLPVASWLICRAMFRTRKGWVAVFVSSVVAGSLLWIAGIHFIDVGYKNDLMRYDLNKDGGFSDAELTPDARAAMKQFANDTGRTLAPVVAPIATTFWMFFLFGICALFSRGVQDVRDFRSNRQAEQASSSNGG